MEITLEEGAIPVSELTSRAQPSSFAKRRSVGGSCFFARFTSVCTHQCRTDKGISEGKSVPESYPAVGRLRTGGNLKNCPISRARSIANTLSLGGTCFSYIRSRVRKFRNFVAKYLWHFYLFGAGDLQYCSCRSRPSRRFYAKMRRNSTNSLDASASNVQNNSLSDWRREVKVSDDAAVRV